MITKQIIRLVITALAGLVFTNIAPAQQDASPTGGERLPRVPREFRGVWIATVGNIDWPKRGAPPAEQRADLVRLLDIAKSTGLNAIVLQVRPTCDTFYPSSLEPWSAYLTGTQGMPPSPAWDPLQFAIQECRKRGLELHAWFNPYRAGVLDANIKLAPNHIASTRPDLVRKYGKYLWLEPTMPAVQDYSMRTIMDVVKRYDIDGIHIDDYFYPYKEKGLDFPDEESFAAYQKTGGNLSRDDWRRAAVNGFVERYYREIKEAKPWVKVGISPFGIWRPGNPPGVKGLDQYAELYADSRLWLNKGWVDYFSPQLYWKIDSNQRYDALLKWWVSQNTARRAIWPGQFTSRVYEGWPASEITNQINVTRQQAGAGGTIHFSMKSIAANAKGMRDALTRSYATPALVPAMTWQRSAAPPQPTMNGKKVATGVQLTWSVDSPTGISNWILYQRSAQGWNYTILPPVQGGVEVPEKLLSNMDAVALVLVDRLGNESAPAFASLR